MNGLGLEVSHKQTNLPQPFLQEVPLASSRLPDPSPFDIDSFFNEWNASQPIEKMAEKKDAFTNVMHSFTKPFIGQGYNTLAALNRGSASFYAHLDSIADFIELSGGGKKEGLFENLAKISAQNAGYWKQRADKVGINFFDELISEAVGGFIPGVSQFSMDVLSGFIFPYMGGAIEAYKKGESPFIGGILEAAKTATLSTLFKMMGPLKKYLQAPTMGTIFGIQEMEVAPEGQKLRAFGKGFGTGVAYSLTSPGGRLGLNEIAENLKPEIAKAAELAKVGKTVLTSERGAIGEKKPEARVGVTKPGEIFEGEYVWQNTVESVPKTTVDLIENAGKFFTDKFGKNELSETGRYSTNLLTRETAPYATGGRGGAKIGVTNRGEGIHDTWAKTNNLDFVSDSADAWNVHNVYHEWLHSKMKGLKEEVIQKKTIKATQEYFKTKPEAKVEGVIEPVPEEKVSKEVMPMKPEPVETLKPVGGYETGKPITINAYHGTTREYKDIDFSKLGENTKANSAKMGMFYSDSKESASTYAKFDVSIRTQRVKIARRMREIGEEENILKEEFQDKINKGIDIPKTESDKYNKKIDLLEEEYRKIYSEDSNLEKIEKGTPRVIENTINFKNPKVLDVQYGSGNFSKEIQKAKDEGHDGVILLNQKDNITTAIDKISGKAVTKPSTNFIIFSKDSILPTLTTPREAMPISEEGVGKSISIPEAKVGVPTTLKEPEAKPRKFLKTVEEASETAPEIKERLEKIQREDPQDYYVQPNKESLEKANKRIDTEGIDKTVDYAFSDVPLNAEKGATFISLMDRFQKEGDFDRAIQMVEAYDMQLREAGRFIQAASIWNKLSPAGFIRWADKQLESTKSKYSWADTIIGNKPEAFSLSKEEKQTIFEKMSEINKMPDGIEKTDATLQVIDMVAQKVPPSVSEMIDAYRYSNMLSSPRTHMRNIGENIFNTFIKRPIDITTRGAYDFVKSSLTGSDRQAYVMDTPIYMKTSINSIPNALNAFMTSWRMETGAEIGKPEVGIEVKGEFQRARAKELPSALTIIPRFMEASDKFNSALIGAGEFAIQKRRGATDAEGYKRASELAEKYLYREKLDSNDPDLSYFSKVLSSLGKMIDDSRKLPGLGTLSKWYVPFIKTPVNKGIQMIESSPLGLARAKFDQEAMAKIMAGSIFTGLGAMFALQGDTTWAPPSDPKEKELFYASGRKPFSVRIGDNWIPIWYLGPYALSFGLPMAVKHYVQDEKKALTQDGIEKLLAIAEGTAQFIGSQTSTQSIGSLFSALQGDIDFKFASQTAFTVGQIIPGQSLIRYINTIIDPVYRKPKGFLENIEKDLPFLSQKLQERQTPLFEPSARETVNYFIPYDIGTTKPIYESILPFQKYEIRQKYLQNKVDELSRKVRNGEMTVEDSMKEMMEIIKVSPKPLEQMGEELLKQGGTK